MIMMPHDFPPPEIIEALEVQLGLDFIHFTVSLDGVVEGVFGNDIDTQVVSFEAKREFLSSFQLPPIESIIAELDENALEDMQKMFKSVLAEIENMTEISAGLSMSEDPPKFDDGWYCP